MKNKSARELILKLLKEKSTLKQDIFHNTIAQFAELKKILKEIAEDLKKEIQSSGIISKVQYIKEYSNHKKWLSCPWITYKDLYSFEDFFGKIKTT